MHAMLLAAIDCMTVRDVQLNYAIECRLWDGDKIQFKVKKYRFFCVVVGFEDFIFVYCCIPATWTDVTHYKSIWSTVWTSFFRIEDERWDRRTSASTIMKYWNILASYWQMALHMFVHNCYFVDFTGHRWNFHRCCSFSMLLTTSARFWHNATFYALTLQDGAHKFASYTKPNSTPTKNYTNYAKKFKLQCIEDCMMKNVVFFSHRECSVTSSILCPHIDIENKQLRIFLNVFLYSFVFLLIHNFNIIILVPIFRAFSNSSYIIEQWMNDWYPLIENIANARSASPWWWPSDAANCILKLFN